MCVCVYVHVCVHVRVGVQTVKLSYSFYQFDMLSGVYNRAEDVYPTGC